MIVGEEIKDIASKLITNIAKEQGLRYKRDCKRDCKIVKRR